MSNVPNQQRVGEGKYTSTIKLHKDAFFKDCLELATYICESAHLGDKFEAKSSSESKRILHQTMLSEVKKSLADSGTALKIELCIAESREIEDDEGETHQNLEKMLRDWTAEEISWSNIVNMHAVLFKLAKQLRDADYKRQLTHDFAKLEAQSPVRPWIADNGGWKGLLGYSRGTASAKQRRDQLTVLTVGLLLGVGCALFLTFAITRATPK